MSFWFFPFLLKSKYLYISKLKKRTHIAVPRIPRSPFQFHPKTSFKQTLLTDIDKHGLHSKGNQILFIIFVQ